MSKYNKLFKKLLFKLGSLISYKAKLIAPYDTGNLKKDIQVFTQDLDRLELEVGNTQIAPYAIFVHQGTGIYGKKKRKIVPKKAKALKTPMGVFKTIEGMKPHPYLQEATKQIVYSKILDESFEEFTQELGEEVIKDLKEVFRGANLELE